MSPPVPTVSPTAFLHLAPTPPRPLSSDALRHLVLEYLASSCYPDTAQAFAREAHDLKIETERGGLLVPSSSSSSPGPSRELARTNGAAATNGTGGKGRSRAYSGHGMEGIEATPPPEGDDEPGSGDDDEVDEGSSRERTNGKAVAFEEGVLVDDDDDEDRDWPMLSVKALQAIRLRRDIRDHILNGRIKPAVDLLKSHFPAVLDPSLPQPAPPPTSRKSPAGCHPLTFYAPTASATSSLPPPPPPTPSRPPVVPVLGAHFSPNSLSLKPTILALNLELQSFVELVRTAASSSTPSTPRTPDSALESSTSSLASTITTSGGGAGGLSKAINRSRRLHSRVSLLEPGKERDGWEQECVDVSGLLAYTDLSICPVRGYLDQGRREMLAEMVNAAVLRVEGKTPMPVLALVAMQTTAIWDSLAQWKVPFPPLPGGATSKESKKAHSKVQALPKFELRKFLEEREPGGR